VPSRYVFDPRDEIADWIDENISSWTNFCYNSIYQVQKAGYLQRFKRLQYEIFLVLAGMIIVALSYTSVQVWVYLLCVVVGLLNILLGFSGLVWEVRNGRRR